MKTKILLKPFLHCFTHTLWQWANVARFLLVGVRTYCKSLCRRKFLSRAIHSPTLATVLMPCTNLYYSNLCSVFIIVLKPLGTHMLLLYTQPDITTPLSLKFTSKHLHEKHFSMQPCHWYIKYYSEMFTLHNLTN